MRARLEQLNDSGDRQSFLSYEVNLPSFDFFWHYHPEYELTLIIRGRGRRLVGSNYENFNKGDLVLLGPYLPHTWVSDKSMADGCSAIVIQFSRTFIEPLLKYDEMEGVDEILAKSEKGLHFLSAKDDDAERLMKEMVTSSGIDAFSRLLRLLTLLCNRKGEVLSSGHFKMLKGNENQQRINIVFKYVQEEFRKKISLKTASSSVHLSVSAFCKFFKRASGKTFSDYVNEIRIANACQLLIETDKTVENIAMESGFESLTYFNRVFLRKKGKKPTGFRKMRV